MTQQESPLNRAQRRQLSRTNKKWLAAVAADPRTTHEELLVAQAIAEHATTDGHIAILDDDLPDEVREQC